MTDLLFASCGIEPEIVDAAVVQMILPGQRAPVAITGHLIATKLLARDDRRRPANADDLRALRAVAVETDWQVAESAVEMITTRGFNRERDLEASLRTLRKLGAYPED